MKKRNLKLRVMVAIAIAVSTGMAPMSGTIAEATTIKAKSNVNVRTAGNSTSEKIGYVYAGEVANYLGTENGWVKIEINGQVGFSSGSYWTGNTVTATSNVNLRSSASNIAEKVGYAVAKTEAVVLGRSGTWLYLDVAGVRGYSFKSYWDLSDTLFYSLPFVNSEMTGPVAPAPVVPAPVVPAPVAPAPSTIKAGDSYKLTVSVTGHTNAADAKSGSNVIKTMQTGNYYVYKVYDGMFNISFVKGVAGAWINPAKNTGVTSPAPTPPPTTVPTPVTKPTPPPVTVPTPEPITPPQVQIQAGDSYTVKTSTNGYLTAADAQAGTNAARTVVAGPYFVYKVFSGMLNISQTKGAPGAWINPDSKTGATDPGVELPSTGDTADQVIKAATSLLGIPYVYGGASHSAGGFDCSGLTQYSYRQAGIVIPRTASQQWAGVSNKVTVPQAGDIIVFSRAGDIYHVGIYIGDDKMIHAPQPGKFVEIKDLAWYYKNNLVHGFLRPIK